MKRLLLLVILACGAALLLPAWGASGQPGGDRGKGTGHGRGNSHGKPAREAHGRPAPWREFRANDREIVMHYYSGPRSLPPGLAKKYARNGRLPPGWEKRFRPFPVVVERELPPICVDCSRGIIDGYAVVFDRRTRIILDVFALASDLIGR